MSYKPARKKDADQNVEIRFLESLNRRTPDHALILKALGDLYTSTGKYQEGLHIDRQLSELCPQEADVWYNLGCSLALVGDKEASFDALYRAVQLGYTNREWMNEDSDLNTIRNDPRFADLLQKIDVSMAD